MRTRGPWSPWGYAQDVEQIADGIQWYNTASHGGFRVTGKALKAIKAKFPGFTAFAHDGKVPERVGWFEEDCDWTIVILSNPEHFPVAQYERAWDQVRYMAQAGWGNGQWAKAMSLLEKGWDIARHVAQWPETNPERNLSC